MTVSLRQRIEAAGKGKRGQLKAAEHAKTKLRHFAEGEFEVTIEEISHSGADLSVTLSVVREGEEQDLSKFNPFIFRNPPTMVPDETTRSVVAEGGGERVEVAYREDLGAALRRMIVDTLRVVLP